MSKMEIDRDTLARRADAYPTSPTIKYTYGTAGFRMAANDLDPVMFRVGLLAALRSMKCSGQVIGVMITASHNPARDNGVKLVDPRGDMLQQSWESYATTLANASSADKIISILTTITKQENIQIDTKPRIVYARDTRSSGQRLARALVDGLNTLRAEVSDAGLKTTPQLHYLVKSTNTLDSVNPDDHYGEPTEEGYYHRLGAAFKTLMHGFKPSRPLVADCANGVGAPKLKDFLEQTKTQALLDITIVKDDTSDDAALNNGCGADHVKSNQRPPTGMHLETDHLYCSYDGDADRIVYYYAPEEEKFRLLDGDKISVLAATFCLELMKLAELNLMVGVVQTAYANGSSTAYLQKTLNIPVACVATGVKHLHHAAEQFDVGVYFEANGHGTVLFSDDAITLFRSKEPSNPAQKVALDHLSALVQMINQTVGDALSDMLLVQTILSRKLWGPKEWDSAYTDLPNRLVKVVVADRTKFKTADAERKLIAPPGIQGFIDGICAKYQSGRSFVRPSGTEDVVRVYAEAASRTECDELAFRVAGLVFDQCGGIGTRPKEFM